MQTISKENYTAIQAKIHQRFGYVDKLTTALATPISRQHKKELEPLCGYQQKQQEKRVATRPTSRHPTLRIYTYDIFQPTPQACTFIAENYPVHLIKSVEISLDLITHTQDDALLLQDFLVNHLRKKWPGHQKLRKYTSGSGHTTPYWCNSESRQNLLAYADRPSKVTGSHCVHIEWRINKTSVLKNYGYTNIQQFINFDFRSFWDKHLLLRDVNNAKIDHTFLLPPKYRRRFINKALSA